MAELEAGTVIAGKYRLLERLTGGGMGAVWRAQHVQLDAPVAVKVMHVEQLKLEDAAARFEREAKASAQIRSPFVVHINDHGIDEPTGMPFIVMELLEGEDLQRRLNRLRRLPGAKAAEICTQICKGLGRAHELGLVHRDLKPANIFLCDPDDEMVKLLDFGIAKETGERKIVGSDTTTPGQVLGTPHYMSPEQARGMPLDPRSDLWSLAVIMFRTVTGKRPFDASDFGDLAVKICSETPPKASSIEPSLGPAVDRFFAKAFDQDRNRRFPSAAAFAEAFQKAVTTSHLPEVDLTPPSVRVAAPSGSFEELPAPSSRRALDPEASESARMQIFRRPSSPAVSPPEPSRGATVLILGVIIAGAIVLVVARRPGQFSLGAIPAAFEDAARDLREAIEGKPVPSGVMPADSASPQERAEDAWRRLYQQVRSGEIPQAVATLDELLELDPEAVAKRRGTLTELTARAIVRPDETADRMIDLLTEQMGPLGPDLLFEVAVSRQDEAGKKAAAMIADPELRKAGSEDMRLAYAIRRAPPCGKKAKVLAAKKAGAALTLREIDGLTDGCPPRQPCCLKNDAAVAAVAEAITARDSEAGKGGSAPATPSP